MYDIYLICHTYK